MVTALSSGIAHPAGNPLLERNLPVDVRGIEKAMLVAAPPLLFGLRLWASVSLALYLAFWLQLDNPYWAGASAAIVCQPQLGASLRKGWFRMIGTLVGAVMSVVLVACFPQDRVLFLGGLALWAAASAFVATVLRNFASYSAALAGYTVAIVGGDLLGTVGGVDANAAFLLAVSRATAICLGIACAGVVLAGTDLGGARRRLAGQFAELCTSITAGFSGALAAMSGREPAGVQPAGSELLRRVIALEPVIDQTIGESSQIRHHSPVLQSAVNGFFAALAAWRAVADHLARSLSAGLQPETAAVIDSIPHALRSAGLPGEAARWADDPMALHRLCEATVRRLIALPAGTSSVRLLADKAAEVFLAIMQALEGLALLVIDPPRPIPRRCRSRIWVADWLPALVNGGRAFVLFGAVALFWVVTGWPGGSGTITFAAIVVLLLGLKADQAYGATMLFTVGAILDVALAAIVLFWALPALGTETFGGFSLVIGLCLVPIGALLALARQPWQAGLFTGMNTVFIPLLSPTNPMSYNPLVFYNTAWALVAARVAAAVSFRLLPPLSPGFRTRRLLVLTLRDLCRVAIGQTPDDWEGRFRARLVALPNEATPLQRARLLAAVSVATEMSRLRDSARRFASELSERGAVSAELEAAFNAVARGKSALATANLARVDEILAAGPTYAVGSQTVLGARAGILVLCETLTDHAPYFDGRTST